MTWYYAESGKQVGPLTEDQFQQLIQAGTIRGETLVWRQGMANWQPCREATGTANSPAPATAPSIGGVMCAECRQSFPLDQVVRFGNAFVCAGCKPLFVQKLREGAPLAVEAGVFRYAGFWIRFAAKMLDGLIVGIPVMVLLFVAGAFAGASLGSNPNPPPAAVFATVGVQIGVQLLGTLLSALYTIFCVAKYAATPGKMICGLKILNADGSKVSTAKAVGRFFAEMVSQMTCYIGYIIAAFDQEKRSLHDHICSTRVIYK